MWTAVDVGGKEGKEMVAVGGWQTREGDREEDRERDGEEEKIIMIK